MKRFLSIFAIGVLSTGLALFAQNRGGNGKGAPPANPPATCPNPDCPNYPNCPGSHAYCDKDGDGICDYTGLPVDQCRQAHGRGQGRGQGQGACARTGAGAQAQAARR